MARLTARNKYLFEGERKFYARGVSYGTFAPNSRGEPFPEPERVAADFALMRELGANVVRTYEPPPPWMMEQAAKCGLRVMVGIPWASHLAFLDSRDLVREIRATIAKTVSDMQPFRDAVFAYTLGNEIRSDIVRWHGPRAISRFVAELRDLGKQIDPEGLFTYANYPSTEYLDLDFLDFLSFNVYLHRESDFRRYLTHVMALSGDLPIVLSETGIDTIREGENSQAEFLEWQSRAAFEMGLSGLIVFAFTDQWYRGGSEITDWAFGLVTRDRKPKPAFNVVAEVFKSDLPPALKNPPKVSVVVAACNAAQTLGACLSSLSDLELPGLRNDRRGRRLDRYDGANRRGRRRAPGAPRPSGIGRGAQRRDRRGARRDRRVHRRRRACRSRLAIPSGGNRAPQANRRRRPELPAARRLANRGGDRSRARRAA